MTAEALTFLIVDDDALMRRAAGNLLRALNARKVLEAANGAVALDILHDPGGTPVDIILCDLNMPGMDGMEFLRNLGNEKSGASVIVASSHDGALISTVKKMAVAYGVSLLGTVQKPISRDHLERFIAGYKPARAAARASSPLPVFTPGEILQGIARKEFEPFYQPKVDFTSGALAGAEALARWRHPRHGLVPPAAFIETLEAEGGEGIRALTLCILEKSAAACARLREAGHAFPVSVNLSTALLADPLLAETITGTVAAAGCSPSEIMLEITESAAMNNVACALENLARLKMHGFGLSIDDYGTGFSNIQQIVRIAVDELKIDQSFVRDCGDSDGLRAIVESSIVMAHKLSIKCVAEGIETQKDWDTLKSLGCDMAQGYFIAKPMDLSVLIDFCGTFS